VALQYGGETFESLEDVFLRVVGRQETSLDWL
jgi:hypothetical protein